jgi:vacuolar protein sorting-associated protein 45
MLPTVVDPPGMQSFCDRAVDGIASVLLALKRRPVIRYQRTSDVGKRVARETAVSQPSLCNISFKIIWK